MGMSGLLRNKDVRIAAGLGCAAVAAGAVGAWEYGGAAAAGCAILGGGAAMGAWLWATARRHAALAELACKVGGALGWLPLAGSLCIAFGYAVIVTYILKALVDSLVGTLMTADTASWFGTFSSTLYSVIPYHIIVVVGTLLTLY